LNIDNIITREDYEKIGGKMTYEQLTEFVAGIVKKSVEVALRGLPAVMHHLTQQAAYLKGLTDKFYDANKDLKAHRPMVAQVIEVVEAENPALSYQQVLGIAGPRARAEILKMGKLNRTPAEKPSQGALNKLMNEDRGLKE